MSETGLLLDTNVISELGRRRPSPAVVDFVRSLSGRLAFVSVLTLGELRRGAELKRVNDRTHAARLDRWIRSVEEEYAERALPVDRQVADVWGRLAAMRPRPVVDALIAATAIVHNLYLVTRNVRDFADTGVTLVDPWK